MAPTGPTFQFAQWAFLFSFVLSAATIVIHVVFALGVGQDASDRKRASELVFAGPGVWALATLLGGVFVALAYWVIHHSTLRPPNNLKNNQGFAEPLAEAHPG